MKLLTLNCFLSPWSPKRKRRLPFIVKALIEESPDIIFLQEVFFSSDANFIAEKLAEVGYNDSFYSKTLLALSKFPIVSRVYREFVPHLSCNLLLSVFETANLIYGKGFQVIRVGRGEQSTILVNTHLLSAYGWDHGVYQKARLRQLTEICDYLKCEETNPVILAGDFNFEIHSPSYEVITRNYGFEDPLRKVIGNTFSTNNLNRKSFLLKKINQRIDHIFVKGFKQNSRHAEIVFQKPYWIVRKPLHISDHYGLTCTIQ